MGRCAATGEPSSGLIRSITLDSLAPKARVAQDAPPAGSPATQPSAAEPERIGERYRVAQLLGRGGMGAVYQVEDAASGRVLALKLLKVSADDANRELLTALFEREFHTLTQLAHPRVIEVYDYALDPQIGAFYTMELLDGGDLKQRTPLPWREACALMFDVCSSLALLHARRLLHRDVSPRNVRCTRDGHAKLIDFGAMTPMGFSRQIAVRPGSSHPKRSLASRWTHAPICTRSVPRCTSR
jgi:serine/threonine protein kinase